MPRADKATVLQRTSEITKLVLAGAEFADIRQYATDHAWGVCDRQLRRYQEMVYKRLARSARRNREQLLGRHLMQRRALYARAVKTGDLRAALAILRDEAELEGLYPAPGSITEAAPPRIESALTRRQRVVKRLEALASGNRDDLRLIEQATPDYHYRMPDTAIPKTILHLLALQHITEQLDAAGLFLFYVWRLSAAGPDREPDRCEEALALTSGHIYRVGDDAWQLFTERVGVDGQFLISENYAGCLLAICNDNLLPDAPDAEALRAVWADLGQGEAPEQLLTAEAKAESWWKEFWPACRDLR